MRMLTVCVLVLFAAPASAQTVEAVLDPLSLGVGAIEVPQAVETDGNEATQEWLIKSVMTLDYRVIAVAADGRLCMGDWFPARTVPGWFMPPTVQKIGNVHKLVTRDMISGLITVVGLTTPQCDYNH